MRAPEGGRPWVGFAPGVDDAAGLGVVEMDPVFQRHRLQRADRAAETAVMNKPSRDGEAMARPRVQEVKDASRAAIVRQFLRFFSTASAARSVISARSAPAACGPHGKERVRPLVGVVFPFADDAASGVAHLLSTCRPAQVPGLAMAVVVDPI